MSDDESWLPRNLRGETFDPRVEQKFGYSNDYDSELNEDFPAWDDSLISVGNGQPGAESANDSALKEAAQDDLPGVLLWELYYRGRERADTGKAVYKRLTARGFIRLINKNNNDIDEFTGDPFDPGTLINRARTVCEIILGGAAEEIDNGNIDAAIDLAYDIGYATKTFQALHGEPLVTFVRAIDNVLVEKSMCRVALTRSGDVKRILVEWPQFKICEGIVTTSAPETVKAQVLERIAATGIEQRVAMAKKVVYRRYQSEAGACFFPALSVGVLPDPAEDLNDVFKAPFVVTVPLVP